MALPTHITEKRHFGYVLEPSGELDDQVQYHINYTAFSFVGFRVESWLKLREFPMCHYF